MAAESGKSAREADADWIWRALLFRGTGPSREFPPGLTRWERKKEKEVLALKDSVLRVKRETEKSIISHFKDYKENIKYQYVLRLVDAVAGQLHEELTERIQVYASDLSMFVDRINNTRIDKEHLSRTMNELVLSAEKISSHIDTLRTEMDSKL